LTFSRAREIAGSLVALLRRHVSGRAGRRRWVRPLVLIALAISTQCSLISIPRIDAGRFGNARELERSDRWRYGYVRQYHGAVLVKVRRTKDEPAFVPPDPADRIAPIMLSELRTRRWRASLELVFYALLIGWVKTGLPRVERAVAAGRSRFRGCAMAGLAGAVYMTAAMLPYLATGYGEPLFSTWRGPGAISSSARVPGTATTYVPSVSYGMLLQETLRWPFVALGDLFDAVGVFEVLVPVVGTRAMLWLMAVVFWGVAVATVACFSDVRRPVSYTG